jgi:Family of unknown function (DUF6183)
MTDDILDELVHRADLDALVRLVDTRCDAQDWSGMLRLREQTRRAVEGGRQLWPVATLAEYRLALLAPGEWAVKVLGEDGGRFTIGPLTEVIAQHHTWAELAPLLEVGPRAALIAHERVLRGEDLTGDVAARSQPPVVDLPLQLTEWEGDPPLADYTSEGLTAAAPPTPPAAAFATVELPERTDVTLVVDDEVDLAVRQLFDPWTASSDGRVEVVAVEGDERHALCALGVPPRSSTLAELSAPDALAWLAWAGGAGGAHGRRRGAALGRFGAWWTLAAFGGLTDDWPVDPSELGSLSRELRWFWWDAGEPVLGWNVQLAVHDPADDVSWAISAHDAR